METPDLKELASGIKAALAEMKDAVKRSQDVANNALDESKRLGGILSGETNERLTAAGTAATKATELVAELVAKNAKAAEEFMEVKTRLLAVEQAGAYRPGIDGATEAKTAGQIAAASDEYKAQMANQRAAKTGPIEVGSFHKAGYTKTAIVNASGQNQPLVPAERVSGIVMPGLRRLTIRDLLPQQRTSSNLIEFARENVFPNNANPQGGSSPIGNGEGETKNESGITFALSNQAVTTLAHFILASRQILGDAAMLQSYIDGRLTYGLKLEEEDELLNGSGAAGQLNGLITQATAFSYGSTNQTILDTLLKSLLQVSLSEYEATGFVLHPRDWIDILTLKDTTNRYLFGDPHTMTQPMIWGKPVVATQSIAYQTFLTGAFALAAEIWDREDAAVRISEHDNDNFRRNLVTLLAEERLALVVYRAAAIVSGSTTFAG